jgi:hypothetical protein
MTKVVFMLATILMIFNVSFATDAIIPPLISCSGTALFEGAFVDLNCSGGYCSGQFPAQQVQVIGKCGKDLNIDYAGYGSLTSTFVSGICKGGALTSTLFSQNLALVGNCMFEDNYYGAFNGSVDSPASYASGYCPENGMTRIFFNGGPRPIIGRCRMNI